jgi:hypothetical protein
VAYVLTSSLRPAFRALATSFVPETDRADAAQWTALEQTIERALAARPPRLRRQIALFVRLLDISARLRHGHSLAALDGFRRTALLERFAASRLLLFRRGVWGLRTLVMLGWYTQPAVVLALGYRASAAGWEARP